MIKDLFGILVIVSVNVIKQVILVRKLLDYENCKCRKKLVDKLADKFTETTEEVELAKIALAENKGENIVYCTVYIVLMIVFFIIFTGIATYFVYYKWSLIKNNVSCIKFGKHINGRNQTN